MTENVDAERTLAAIAARPWQGVLLRPRSKKPTGKSWAITRDVARLAQHMDTGGNLGLLAGERTGVAILDPDEMLPWADMINTLGQPAAAWVLTGRGRLHYYVRWEPDLPAKLEWDGKIIGECQRGPGLQQCVAPPSVHPDTGKRYEWLVDPATQPLEPLPRVWLAYLRSFTYGASHGRGH